ncbi:unnamed protein product [Phaedon cochleariae]|uniref:Uncharacterized protein n=1 Tax=Phaedon cochleariae TaxID=80249 RepID=A0A9P0DC17_PHACE|nr:unnamed protein product [Phaedon cochleariae]
MRKSCLKKVAIITGANQGIGYETALGLAKRKMKIIMADKADQTNSKNKIISETGNEEIITEHLDLASFQSIRKFSEKFHHTNNHLDILINNAGVFCCNKQTTIDGLDAVMQINYLGPFLLTKCLENLLMQTVGSRIIFVSSSGSFYHKMRLINLREPNYYNPYLISGAIQYYNSKLCTMIAAKGFSEKLYSWNVISNCFHPGMTNTDFLIADKKSTLVTKVVKRALVCLAQDKKNSAALSIFLATSESIKCVSGQYFVDYRVQRRPAILDNQGFCQRIWDESVELVSLAH